MFLETSTLYHIFTSFHSRWGDSIANKNQPPSNLAKHQYFYTRDLISFLQFEEKELSIANAFRNIHFLPIFTIFNSEQGW